MTSARTWTDELGAVWPVTGHWCSVCGRPLAPVDGSSTHPICAPDEPVITPTPTVPRGPFVLPSGPGRCTRCGWDQPTQGHRPDCSERTAP